jgi:hypothetical protein
MFSIHAVLFGGFWRKFSMGGRNKLVILMKYINYNTAWENAALHTCIFWKYEYYWTNFSQSPMMVAMLKPRVTQKKIISEHMNREFLMYVSTAWSQLHAYFSVDNHNVLLHFSRLTVCDIYVSHNRLNLFHSLISKRIKRLSYFAC